MVNEESDIATNLPVKDIQPDLSKILQQAQEASANASQEKQRIIQLAVNVGQITHEYADLLGTIDTATTETDIANLHKVQAALGLRERLLAEGLGAGRVAYIGSGSDWQFPVALGAREIDMVDLDYLNPDSRNRLLNSIRAQHPDTVYNGGILEFSVYLGAGPEKVALHLIGADVKDYIPETELSGVVETAGPTKFITTNPVTPNVAAKIKERGVIANFDFQHQNHGQEEGLVPLIEGGFTLYQVGNPVRFIKSLHDSPSAVKQAPSLESLRALVRPKG